MRNVLTGNLGIDTFYKVPEIDIIGEYLPITLEMVLVGLVGAIILALITGTIAAANKDSKIDGTIKATYLITWSTPGYLIAFALQLVFAYKLKLLPAGGLANPLLSSPPYPNVTHALALFPRPIEIFLTELTTFFIGFPIIRSLIDSDWVYFSSLIHHMVLPSLTLALIAFGSLARIVRASTVEALDKDYIRLAYMKGLSKRQVVYGTAFRNAVIPVITIIALMFGFAVAGAVIIEYVFNYYGMGYFLVQAIYNLDYIAILATTLLIGISVILFNTIADILYGVVDPRVRTA